MIVVIGSPVFRPAAGTAAVQAAGLAGDVALAAAAEGRAVQVVGKVGDDDSGDALLVALAHGRVGHAAVLRDAVNATPVAPASDASPGDAAETSPVGSFDEPDQGGGPGGFALPAGLPLDAADVQLALRYLTDFRVVVIAAPLDPAALGAAIEAASFAGAHLIRLDQGDAGDPDAGTRGGGAGGPEVTAFEPPAGDEPAFGSMVGRYAAGLDAGRSPADAFAQATQAANWERVGPA